jgi:hypothetical protein
MSTAVIVSYPLNAHVLLNLALEATMVSPEAPRCCLCLLSSAFLRSSAILALKKMTMIQLMYPCPRDRRRSCSTQVSNHGVLGETASIFGRDAGGVVADLIENVFDEG